MTPLAKLHQHLAAWVRWERTRRAFVWAWRGLLLALFLSLVLDAIGILQTRILISQFWLLPSLLALTVLPAAALTAYYWPIPPAAAARRFDAAFGLRERVSTALELPPSHPFAADLLQDTLRQASQVKPRLALPLRIPLREKLLAPVFALALLLLFQWGQPAFVAAQQTQNVEKAIAQETANIEELIREVQKNPALTPEQKEALTAPLKEAQSALQENPTQESAVSVLAQTSEKLETISGEQAGEMAQALREAGQQAARAEGSPLEALGEQLANGENFAAAQQLANLDVANMSQAEQQATADQLEQMADALQQSNPALAEELRRAAEALRNGDEQAAQEALQRASEQMAQAGQQVANAQAAQSAASQLQTGAQRVIQAGGGQNQPGQAAQANGQQPGQGSQPGQGEQGQPGQNGQNNGQQGAGGSGQGQGNGQLPQGGEAGNGPIQPNGASDGGESGYEPLYAPSLLGGEGGEQVHLPGQGDGSGETISTGPTNPGQPGRSNVPYDQVYAEYDEINNQAIENGQVPLDYQQIIRNYFDSLKP